MSDLPAGWAFAFADDLTAPSPHALAIGPFGSNLKVSDYRDSGVPLVFVRNIRAKAFGSSDLKFVSGVKASTLLAHQVEQGDVLVTKMGDPPGDSAIYPLEQRGVITADCIKLTPHPSINGRYLMYALETPAIKQQVLSITRGVAQPKVSLDRFRKGVRFPVAPTGEQNRIVAAIEEEFSRIDAGLAAVERARRSLKRMRAAVLVNAFAQLQEDVAATRGAELFSFVTSGSRGWAKYYSNDGPAFIRIGNVPRDGIDLDPTDAQRVNPPANAERMRTRVQPGDLLISITADLGRVAVVPPSLGEAYINQHLALARPTEGAVSRYLGWYFASPLGLRQWDALRRGATKIGLGLDDIRATKVPMPTMSVQLATVEAIESAWSVMDVVEDSLVALEQKGQHLRSSVLRAAFSGEIARQDPNDEPASVLLDSIVRERGSSNGTKRRSVTKPRKSRNGVAA